MSEYRQSTTKGYGSKVTLSFGLVTIPIRLHLVADSDRSVPARSMFTPDGNPVGNKLYDKTTGADVDRGSVVKMAAFGDQWVELSDDEIEENTVLVPGLADITGFVPADEFAALYVVEKPAAWRPDRIKIGNTKMYDPAPAKAVALLCKAMAARNLVALALVPSKSGAQYVALMPDGSAGWVAFATAARPIDPMPEIEVSDVEMGLADQLIDQIGVSAPVLVDVAAERLRTYIASKAETAGVAPTVTPKPTVSPADGLLAALAASIPATKPAAKRARKAA